MSFTAGDIEDGTYDSIDSILGRYADGDDINTAIFGDLSSFNLDEDVEDLLQNYTQDNTSFWDSLYGAASNEYVGIAVSETTLGVAENVLTAQSALTLTIKNEVKALITQSVTIETAVVDYLDGLPVKAYVEKATGLIVRSDTVLSETTHIPVGKFIAGAGHAVGAYAIFETFKDTIEASYNATLGQEDTFTPLQEYLIAGTAVVAGGAVAPIFGGATVLGVAAGGIATGVTVWAADELIDSLPGLIYDAKVATKTLQQTLDDAYASIKDTINDAWAATGEAAEDILDDGAALLDDILDGIKDLTPDLDLPPLQLPEFVNDAKEPWNAAPNRASPLVLDLDNDGIELTEHDSETTATFFDIDGDGFAEQTAWVDADDGLLARDINENGIIDDVTELFGSPTVDGFAKLALLDSNQDLLIDQNDDAWDELVIWKDANGDAVTQDGELHTLSSLSIKSIDLAGVAASTSTVNGNPISHETTYMLDNGSTRSIVDAWFVNDNVNTSYIDSFTIDPEVLFLPTLRGFGKLADLHVAMSQDEDLKELVEDFVDDFDTSGFALSTLDDDIEAILFQWGGATEVNPTSRGPFIDARMLVFMEQFFGNDFYQSSWQTSNPMPVAGYDLEEAWQILYDNLKKAIILQAGGNILFDDPVTYDVWAGTITGDANLSEDAINDLATNAPSAGPDNDAYWVRIGEFIDLIKGLDNVTTQEAIWLDDAIYSTDNNLSWNDIADIVGGTVPTDTINGTSGNDTLNGDTDSETINGYAGDDTIHGYQANDTIYGGDDNDTIYGDTGSDELHGENGTDTLYGGDGNDTLYGDDGADILDGGDGGNILYGGEGNDTYIYNSGAFDYYSERFYTSTGGADEIQLPSGIVLGDLSFYRMPSFDGVSLEDVLILIDGGGSIQLEYQFRGSNYEIETLRFYDTSTLDLTDLGNLEVRLTSDDDQLVAELSATYQDDVVYGLGGDDLIRTYAGDDVLDGGLGNDTLDGGADNDTYIASPGFDRIQENGYGGTDTIEIPEGYTVDDVVFYHSPPSGGQLNNLTILIDGLGQIVVQDHFYGSAYAVEYLHFLEDDSTVALTDLSVLTIGTSGNDTLAPPNDNASLDDIFDGREGDDLYYTSGAGDDVFVFSAGNDTINGEASGEDTIRVRGNYDPGDISIYRIYNGGAGDSLVLEDTDGNTITALSHFHSSLSNYQIEHVQFADSTVWNILEMEIEARGTSGNDTLYGADSGDASSDDIMYGYAGNDNLVGGDGDDILYGGDDNDSMSGGAGNDALYGGSGSDTLQADGGGTDILYGEDGVDYLYAYFTTASLYGGAGDDFLYGGGIGAVTTMHGGAGDDTLSGYTGTDIAAYSTAAAGVVVNLSTGTTSDDGDGGTDTLSSIENVIGSNYNDTITGDSNANVLDGGAGDDVLKGGAGNDTLTGGAGTDTADYSSAAGAVTVNLSTGSTSNDGDSGSDTLSGIENVIGSGGADTITGSTSDNVLNGGAGNDTLDGGSGNDVLIGGAGTDSLTGGNGTDTVDYSNAAGAVTVDLSSGTASNDGDGGSDTLATIENVIGSANGDTITGSTAANVLNGGAGNDNIDGGSGNDTLIGGAGNDTLTGNTGTDTVDYSAAAAGVTVNLSTGSASNDGDGGSDTLSGIENVTGSAGADNITGDTGNNELHGGAGNDTISGGSGTDIISGGLGDDTLDGGSGAADRVSYENSLTAVNINFNTGAATGEGTDSLTGFEKATGSAFNDTFTGNSSVNTFDGGAGNDTAYGAGGNDVINGEDGDDILYGDDGQDKIDGGEGNDIIYGGAGNDNIGNTALNGGGGNDIIYGGDGDDKMTGGIGSDILYGGDGLDRLEGGDTGGAYGVNIFVLEAASAFNDVDYIVDFNPNQIVNGGGVDISDLLSAYDPGTDDIADFVNVHVSGSDTYIAVDADGGGDGFVDVVKLEGITTLPGIDTLVLQGMLILDQRNYIFGTNADETLNGTANADYIYTGFGMNTVYAGAGDDFVMAGNSFDNLYGEDGDDILWGYTGADNIYGGDGNDYLYGDANVDHLYGGAGDDVLYGGADGGDFMSGGAGADIMTGGTYDDTFIFEAATVFDAVDTITNFNAAWDYIDFSDVLDGFYDPLSDAIGDFVTFTENSGDTEVSIDLDGTGGTYTAVQAILLEGVTGLNVATLEGNGHLITSV